MKQSDRDNLVRFLIFFGIIVFVITGGAVLIPLAIIGSLYYYFTKKQNIDFTDLNNKNFMNGMDYNAMKTKFKHTTGGVFILGASVILLFNMLVIVPAGQTGVYHLFGKVSDDELESGIHLINPFATVQIMSIQTQQYTMSSAQSEGQRIGDDSIESLTKEGLKVSLDMTVLYHLDEKSASDVYREIGIDYEEKIIRPEVRSAIREVIALYEAKDIYSEKREEAVVKIETVLTESLMPRGIQLESVLLRNVKLPQMLASGIEEKLTAEQEAQKYDFILQKETKEAERKIIEAQGQRDAQKIINESLTGNYLQYLYIQNLENREGTIYVPYDLPLLRGL